MPLIARAARSWARTLERRRIVAAVGSLALAACGGVDDTRVAAWQVVAEAPDAALLSVGGTAADDVWMVGADAGDGPAVLHWDGSEWERRSTGASATDLWWVHPLSTSVVYLGGSNGTVLQYRDGSFERMATPGLGKHIVFGVWAASEQDVYAVGSAQGRNGFIWHYDGERWVDLALPGEIELDDNSDAPALFKVWGASAEDVWVVGDRGLVLQGNARDGFRLLPEVSSERLFTVHGAAGRVVMVGGSGNATALEVDGGGLTSVTPPGAGLLQGVNVSAQGSVWAVGIGGAAYEQAAGSSEWRSVTVSRPVQSLHAVWVDPSGGVWAVGGDVLTNELDDGVALYYDSKASITPTRVPPRELPSEPACPEAAVDPFPEGSIARRWNEQLLNAIRRDVPRPTVHARNLFHTSIAMWDAWAAFDDVASEVLRSEAAVATDLDAARREAISYAAYRVLQHRYRAHVGGALSAACFDAFMARLGYDVADTVSDGSSPRALGNRIGFGVIEAYAADGANEVNNYADPEGYVTPVARLVVDLPGVVTGDPTRWQELVLSEAITQNGISLESGTQLYIGSHWGKVVPFALERPGAGQPYLDIGEPPTALNDDLVDAAVDVIRKTAELDIADQVRWDLSPGGYGNNPLGTNDGRGRAQNPVTGEPYAPNYVLRGDFARTLAEFWADGPASETPPGHWNTLANAVSYDARFERRLFGEADVLDPLAWDVHLYLALNGAVHDAAIAAWELKREYECARPITLIRYLGGLGQRTDPAGPSYHPGGLPLVDDLIEVITADSSSPGGRHAHLGRYVGEIAVRSWPGEPGDRERTLAPIGWMRARDWMPYQRRFFVTPAFPGYVSGHSTFSRAAAVVLHQLTGSEFFPGGLGRARFEPGYLVFEHGPSEPIELQWASYYDASDQAGQSRLWGGIHIRHDDFDGRRIGALVGELAVQRARAYFDGTAGR